jgi:hypothetical protein
MSVESTCLNKVTPMVSNVLAALLHQTPQATSKQKMTPRIRIIRLIARIMAAKGMALKAWKIMGLLRANEQGDVVNKRRDGKGSCAGYMVKPGELKRATALGIEPLRREFPRR